MARFFFGPGPGPGPGPYEHPATFCFILLCIISQENYGAIPQQSSPSPSAVENGGGWPRRVGGGGGGDAEHPVLEVSGFGQEGGRRRKGMWTWMWMRNEAFDIFDLRCSSIVYGTCWREGGAGDGGRQEGQAGRQEGQMRKQPRRSMCTNSMKGVSS